MKALRNILAQITSSAAGIFAFVISTVGWVYWLWMAVQFKSFPMFFLAFFGPLAIVVGPVGLWSLVFGSPHWLISLFGS